VGATNPLYYYGLAFFTIKKISGENIIFYFGAFWPFFDKEYVFFFFLLKVHAKPIAGV